MADLHMDAMRRRIGAQYGESWNRRVDLMPDAQVYAIYMRMCENGGSLHTKHKKHKPAKKRKQKQPSTPVSQQPSTPPEEGYEQLSLFDPPMKGVKDSTID